MKAYSLIESLAEDAGISERTAWRWLRSGKIKKKNSEDGQIIFVLVDESTGITDKNVSDNVSTDVSDMSVNDSDVNHRRTLRDKKSTRAGNGSLVQSMMS